MRDGSHKPIIVAEDLEQSEVPKSKIGCGPNASVNACHFIKAQGINGPSGHHLIQSNACYDSGLHKAISRLSCCLVLTQLASIFANLLRPLDGKQPKHVSYLEYPSLIHTERILSPDVHERTAIV